MRNTRVVIVRQPLEPRDGVPLAQRINDAIAGLEATLAGDDFRVHHIRVQDGMTVGVIVYSTNAAS